jgi:flagellar basal-body rod protein FlgF
MENASFIALSRLGALRRQMEVVANNIANMNTAGFKNEKMMFVDHLIRSKGGEKVFGHKLHYVRDVATMRDSAEGQVNETGNPLDFAISGEGYFAVQTPEGVRYTRNGRFQLDQNGQLVNQNGLPVLSQGGQPFTFGPQDRDIVVSRDGTVAARGGSLGKLRVVRFDNDSALTQAGNGLFNTTQEPREVAQPAVIQGALESSNVQPITEIARMIEVQRAYESTQRFIDREDERMRAMIREMTRAA